MKKLFRYKHSSLFFPSVSDEDKKVLWHWHRCCHMEYWQKYRDPSPLDWHFQQGNTGRLGLAASCRARTAVIPVLSQFQSCWFHHCSLSSPVTIGVSPTKLSELCFSPFYQILLEFLNFLSKGYKTFLLCSWPRQTCKNTTTILIKTLLIAIPLMTVTSHIYFLFTVISKAKSVISLTCIKCYENCHFK